MLDSDRHIGNIKLGPVDWLHRVGDLGLIIEERGCWGKDYAFEAISLEYAFGQLNLRKVTAGCYALNQGSIEAFQKAGFVIEGVRRQNYHCDGNYDDGILLGMLRSEGARK
jgi:ribosomal-protein-alanine N-acetyltransferase